MSTKSTKQFQLPNLSPEVPVINELGAKLTAHEAASQ
jgi:hypothetical protein